MVFILIAAIDIPSVMKKKTGKVKYLVLIGLIVIIGFTVSLLQIGGKAPISPSKIIEYLVKVVLGEL